MSRFHPTPKEAKAAFTVLTVNKRVSAAERTYCITIVSNFLADYMNSPAVADAARLEWIKTQLEHGSNIEFTREFAELDDGTTGPCVMVYHSPQTGPNEGCGECIAGHTEFREALDEAAQVLNTKPTPRRTT